MNATSPTKGAEYVAQGPTLVSAQEILEAQYPSDSFLVDGLMPRGLSMLAGPPKTGKSWFGLQLSLNVALGRQFLGADTTQGDVLYVPLEDSKSSLQHRMEVVIGDSTDDPALQVLENAPRIDEGLLEQFVDWADRVPNPQLIMVDPLGHVLPPKTKLNDYADMVAFLRPVKAFANERGIDITFVHHTRKPDRHGNVGDPFDGILGSTGTFGTIDTAMVLQGEADAHLHVRGRDIPRLTIRLQKAPDGITWIRDERDPSLAELRGLTGRKREVTEAIEALAGEATLAQLAQRLGLKHNNVANVLRKLMDSGIVVREGKGEYRLVEPESLSGQEDEDAASIGPGKVNESREETELLESDFIDLDNDLDDFVEGVPDDWLDLEV